jgi:hypothetical protein
VSRELVVFLGIGLICLILLIASGLSGTARSTGIPRATASLTANNTATLSVTASLTPTSTETPEPTNPPDPPGGSPAFLYLPLIAKDWGQVLNQRSALVRSRTAPARTTSVTLLIRTEAQPRPDFKIESRSKRACF